MGKYFRVTWEGYIEGEYESDEEAKQALIDFINNDEFDNYGRTWEDLIAVEELTED